nr:NADH dehydrogenase subunit 3 [Ulochaetes vacca]
MKILIILTLLFSMIIIFLMMLMIFLSKKTFMDQEKNSPFECGFDPKSTTRLPFSLHFFLIAVIFLIFDVEITLIFPMILMLTISNLINYSILLISFLLILLMGLFHEWNQGALNWIF